MPSDLPLQIENLTFRYQRRSEPAIQDINLSLQAGEILLIAGASGCGKTTLARCINGLIPRSYKGELQGKLLFFGQDLSQKPLSRISQVIGTVLQDPERQILGTRVQAEIAFGLENLGRSRPEIMAAVGEALETLGIAHLRERETFNLSGGEKQKVALAGVLAMRPSILLLDEPLASLDPASAQETLGIVRRLADGGMAVLLIEHRVEDVLGIRPDRVLFMQAGQVRYLGKMDGLQQAVNYHEVKLPAAMVIEMARRSMSTTGVVDFEPEVVKRAAVDRQAPRQPLVEFDEVDFGYEEDQPVLKGISLKIYRGDVIAVLGANGAGKTTLVKHAIGLLKPRECMLFAGTEWGYDRIYVENADGTEAGLISNMHGQCLQPNNWQKFTLSFVPTGNTVQVSVGQFGPKATVEIYFDNVQLVASPNTVTPNTTTPAPGETSSVTETPTSTPTATETPASTPTLPVAPVGQLTQAKYTYDGDGNLVKSEVTSLVNDVPSVTVTYYAGKHYNVQVTGEVTKTQKTYSFGGQTVAVRTTQGSQNWLTWILTDNLGSTSVTANADGSFNSEIRYSAFGEIRTESGTTPTNYKYTGQLSQPELGLDYYVARWYDPVTSHFTQADTEISTPGEPQTFDRYMYVNNDPIDNNDPTGLDCMVWVGSFCAAYANIYWNYDPDRDYGTQALLASVADPIKLSKGGEKIFSWFWSLNNNPGYWNDYRVGGLSVQRFAGMEVEYEGAGNDIAQEFIRKATAAQYWMGGNVKGGGNAAYCGASKSCTNGVFNQMAAFGGYKPGDSNNPPSATWSRYHTGMLAGPPHSMTEADNLGATILNKSNWGNLNLYTSPYSWGNRRDPPPGNIDANGILSPNVLLHIEAYKKGERDPKNDFWGISAMGVH